MNKAILTEPRNWLIIAVMVLIPLTALLAVKHFNLTVKE
jgi:hypothetical protein